MPALRNHDGFTMIELMVTIAVLAILLAAGIPAFNDMFDRHRLKTVAETAYQDLIFARSEAIKRNDDVFAGFTAGNDGTWCYGLSLDSACDCAQTDASAADYCAIAGAAKITDGDQYASIDMTVGFPGNDTSFDPMRGTADSGSVTFTSAGGYSAEVTVNGLGRVTLCSDDPALGYPGC